MVSFECRSLPIVISLFSIQVIFFVFTVLITIVATYKFCTESGSQIYRVIKYLCIIALLLCIISVGPGLGLLTFWFQECTQGGEESPIGKIAGAIGAVSYSFTLTFLYLIFSCRIYTAFLGSIYQLSKITKYLLIIMFFIQLIVNISGVIAYTQSIRIGLIFISFIVVK